MDKSEIKKTADRNRMLREGEVTFMYRQTFLSTPESLETLKDIMRMLHFGSKGTGEIEMAMHNVALEILTRCGITVEDIINSIGGIE
jgi:hypothetical protein